MANPANYIKPATKTRSIANSCLTSIGINDYLAFLLPFFDWSVIEFWLWHSLRLTHPRLRVDLRSPFPFCVTIEKKRDHSLQT